MANVINPQLQEAVLSHYNLNVKHEFLVSAIYPPTQTHKPTRLSIPHLCDNNIGSAISIPLHQCVLVTDALLVLRPMILTALLAPLRLSQAPVEAAVLLRIGHGRQGQPEESSDAGGEEQEGEGGQAEGPGARW